MKRQDAKKPRMKETARARLLKFACEFFACGNATTAAQRAGWKGARHTLSVRGSEALRSGVVKKELARLQAAARSDAVMSRTEALEKLTAIARFDFGGLVNGGEIDLSAAREKGALLVAAGVSISPGKYGDTIKVEIPSRLGAIEAMAKLQGWEQAPQPNGGEDNSGLSDAELLEFVKGAE